MIIIFSVLVILIFVNVFLVLLMEVMGFSCGDYVIIMVFIVGVSMVVFFFIFFVFGLFKL